MLKKSLLVMLLLIISNISLRSQSQNSTGVFNEPTNHSEFYNIGNEADIIYYGNFKDKIADFSLSNNWIVEDIDDYGALTIGNGEQGEYSLITPELEVPKLPISAIKSIFFAFDEEFNLSNNSFGEVWIISEEKEVLLDIRSGKSSYRDFSIDLTSYNGKKIKIEYRLKSNSSSDYWKIKSPRLLDDTRELRANIQHISSRYIKERETQFVYLDVNVNGNCPKIEKFNRGNFEIRESLVDINGYSGSEKVQEIYLFEQPAEKNHVKTADIVFVLDVTSSMSNVITDMRNNIKSFLDTLEKSGIDYHVGFVVFGNNVLVLNNGELYTARSQILHYADLLAVNFGNMYSGSDIEENQFGAIMAASEMNFRENAKKVMITITDAPSLENDVSVTPNAPSQEVVIDRLVTRNIACYPIFDLYQEIQRDQYIPLSQNTTISGKFYHIGTKFDVVMEELLDELTNTYRIVYKSNNIDQTKFKRRVTVKVSYDSNIK